MSSFPSLSSSDKRRIGDSLVPACRVVDGIVACAEVGLGFLATLRNMGWQEGKGAGWRSRTTLNRGWDKADPRCSRSHDPRAWRILGRKSRKAYVKYRMECILIGDELMIPLYQSNPYDNPVRKNVGGRAAMGVFLSLLHEFGLDLLGPSNLAERMSCISEGWIRSGWLTVLLLSGEDILGSLRPGPYTDSEHPPARSTTEMHMNVMAEYLVRSIYFGELLPVRETSRTT